MNDLPHLGAPKVAALFGNGRSPACWQRQVSRTAARQAALARACAWVDIVVKQPVPTLRAGPLLGGCLAELVAVPPPARQAEIATPPRPARSPASAARGRVSQDQSQPQGKEPVRKRAFIPPGRSASGKAPSPPKPTAAPSRLLSRWAGKTAVSRPSPAAAPRRALLPSQSSQPAALPPEANHASRQWAGRTTGRTRQQLTQRQQDAPDSWPNGTKTAGKKGSQPGSVTAFDAPRPSLEMQWQQPLAGQRVPLALLQKLRDGAVKAVAAGNAKADRMTGAIPARPSRERETAVPASIFSMGQTGTAFMPQAHPQHGKSDAAELQGSTELEERPSPTRPAPTPAPAEAILSRFAPPQLAEMLPGLRPLPRPGTTNTFPTAAATAESSGRREGKPPALETTAFEAAPPDDLDTLARQIKQILEEESRRHGIDV